MNLYFLFGSTYLKRLEWTLRRDGKQIREGSIFFFFKFSRGKFL